MIAEVALAHDGSLGAAHAYLDAAADAGADAVKFQTHIASEESSAEEQFRVPVFPQDATRYAYWERTAFTEEQWLGLKQHADARGVLFLSSPFSVAAVHLLRRIGTPAWKIGSGETNNALLLDACMAGNEPVLVSTGMSYWKEIDAVVGVLQARDIPVLLMQCTSRYPCPPDQLGLNLIPEYADRYGCPAGFSDHSGELAPAIAAATLGAKAIEVHVTWHRKSFGPDVKSSLTLEQFAELTRGVRQVEAALAASVDKDGSSRSLEDMRQLFTKGLVAREPLRAGTQLEARHLDARKPCIGIPASRYKDVVGKTTTPDIEQGGWIRPE